MTPRPSTPGTTAAPRNSMRSELWQGRIWYGLEQFVYRGVGLLVSVVLVRLLQPDAFGLIASISILLLIAQNLIDGGIADRVIQKAEATEEDFNALYWSNLAISLIACGSLFLSANAIATFFDEPRLVAVVKVMSGVLLFMKAGRVHYCLLMRQLRFKAISLILIVSCTASGVAAIIVAFQGGGYWAILVQHMTLALVRTSLYWSFVPWRPGRPPRWQAIRDIYAFGTPILVSQTIRGMAEQMMAVLGGKQQGMTALGFYDRGRFIPGHAEQVAICIFSRANLAVLSKFQTDQEGFIRSYREIVSVALPFSWIGFAVLAGCIEDLILLIYGEAWAAAVPYAQLSCALAAIHFLFLINIDVFKSRAQIRAIFNHNLMYAGGQVMGVLAGMQWGFTGMLIGSIIMATVACVLQVLSISRRSPLTIMTQLIVLLPPFVTALGTYAVLSLANGLMANWHAVLRLLGGAAISAVIGAAYMIISKQRRSTRLRPDSAM